MAWIDGFEHFVRESEPLGPYTWFRLGGVAQYFAEPTSIEELAALVQRCGQDNVPVRILGGGSNVLVRDEGVPGVVINLSAPAFCEIAVDRRTIRAGGGAKLSHVISTSVREGLAGLEQLVGIPGTVGGALHGNAGTHSGDIGQWTCSATVMTRQGEILPRSRQDLRFAYRQSSLDELVILAAQFELEEENPQQLTQRMQKLWIVKKSTQPPSNQGSGCIFRDSGGIHAARLIEQAGLKGTRVGGAEIYDANPNFIVVAPNASTQDVLRLIELTRDGVAERLGVELETNIEIW